jgi:hypothetical protein
VEAMEKGLRRRAQSPAAVSRTVAAREATRDQREHLERAEEALVRSVAREAGMPIDAD